MPLLWDCVQWALAQLLSLSVSRRLSPSLLGDKGLPRSLLRPLGSFLLPFCWGFVETLYVVHVFEVRVWATETAFMDVGAAEGKISVVSLLRGGSVKLD